MKRFRKFLENISLEYHDTLNPLLWDEGVLKPDVRDKLLKIGQEWVAFCKIPPDQVQDMIITGGNCNFNYTPYSDVDLHIKVDKSKLSPQKDLVDDYMKTKKSNWTLRHKIKIKGYDVELYTQDINEYLASGGIYSITSNKWIEKPVHLNGIDWAHDPILDQKADFWKHMIDKAIEDDASLTELKDIFDKIVKLRRDSIKVDGEFGLGNLVFKELRNSGHLQKIDAYRSNKIDSYLSLS